MRPLARYDCVVILSPLSRTDGPDPKILELPRHVIYVGNETRYKRHTTLTRNESAIYDAEKVLEKVLDFRLPLDYYSFMVIETFKMGILMMHTFLLMHEDILVHETYQRQVPM